MITTMLHDVGSWATWCCLAENWRWGLPHANCNKICDSNCNI